MSRKRKNKRAEEAVPDEVLAEGSGPHQDADSLAEAASEALANAREPEQVLFDAADEPAADEPAKPRRRRGPRVTEEPAAEVDLA
ncbi:MAG TPA: hypothetical protein VIV40_33960, partial [Kofleriaceae bacterium]